MGCLVYQPGNGVWFYQSGFGSMVATNLVMGVWFYQSGFGSMVLLVQPWESGFASQPWDVWFYQSGFGSMVATSLVLGLWLLPTW